MERHAAGLAVVVCCGLVAVLVAGCGGGMQPGGGLVDTAGVTVPLAPYADGASQTPRWMDLADALYMTSFRSKFAYPAGKAQLVLNSTAAGLSFQIIAPARALKPNFCYQMKIEGPAIASTPAGLDPVNAALGYNGRWWDDTRNIPLTDADIPSYLGDTIKGYLYFDFIVTAADGSINVTVPVANSYHVTFKSTQQTRLAKDGPLRVFKVNAVKDGWAYDNKKATSTSISLFGEAEPGRAAPGTLKLPAGSYSGVEFRLTEESFHATSTYGGKWRTVMNASLPTFSVQ